MKISSQLINSIIKNIDQSLNQYSSSFNKEKVCFETLTNNIADIRNERTVASVCNLEVYKELSNKGFDVKLAAQEFFIRFENGLTTSIFNNLERLVGRKVKDNRWPYCYVDGYFKIDNMNDLSGEPIKNLFIEYKMQNTFEYLDLARDYLKYKCYTLKSSDQTAFVYVIMKKEENYPSILSKDAPYYQFLDYKINETTLKMDKSVYIFKTHNSEGDLIGKDIDGISQTLDDTTLIAHEIELIQNDERSTVSEEDLKYIRAMKKFNKKVICSKYLKDNYAFIKNVWNKSNELKLFDNIEFIYNVKNLTSDILIDDGASHLAGICGKLSGDDKVESIEKGMHASVNKSLFIVTIFDYFCDVFNIDVERPHYGTRNVRTGSRKTEISNLTPVKYFKNLLTENYPNNKLNILKKLCHSLLNYIIKLYNILFVIEDDIVGDYKRDFVLYKLTEELDGKINQLKKQINLKMSDFTADDLVFSNNRKELQLELLNSLLNYLE